MRIRYFATSEPPGAGPPGWWPSTLRRTGRPADRHWGSVLVDDLLGDLAQLTLVRVEARGDVRVQPRAGLRQQLPGHRVDRLARVLVVDLVGGGLQGRGELLLQRLAELLLH